MVDTVCVTISQGSLKGKKVTSENGITYYSFQGIPYAKPPVGPLRFKAPQPPEKWQGVRDALSEASVAPQLDGMQEGKYRGEEDCLYLNVYTPKVPPNGGTKGNLPVMFYIHGGGYYEGYGNAELYGPGYLLTQDIILVTCNYRLGALGYLSTGDSVVPGNNGMKDQVMALKWVQENVAQFGGDPGNVTIFGESAGGACVHLHTLSPMSKGMFHRAIAQSATALCPWAYDDPSEAREKAFKLGVTLGCKSTDSKELIDFLSKKSAKELVEGSLETLTEEESHPAHCLFAPTIDAASPDAGVFLPDSPHNLISKGKFLKAPFMTGVTSNEGMIALNDINSHPLVYQGFKIPFPNKLNCGNKYEEAVRKVKEFYMGSKSLSKDTVQNYLDIISDMWFIADAVRTIKEQSRLSTEPIYFYHFAFDGKLKFGGTEFIKNRLPGASHADELVYIFSNNFKVVDKPSPEDEKTIKRMVKLWTNFAKTGNPTPGKDPLLGITWKPAAKSELNYLNIDKELSMKQNIHPKRVEFWEKLYSWLHQES